jgi:hypothetical protein
LLLLFVCIALSLNHVSTSPIVRTCRGIPRARVKDENRRGAAGLLDLGVVRVGPKRVYLQELPWPAQAYELETGVEIGYGHRHIIEADLHRIRRDLAPKPKASKATK